MKESVVAELNPSLFLQLQEEERQRLANALAQGPGQFLANALIEIEYSLPLLEKNPRVAVSGLNQLRIELRRGLEQLQNFVAELQPPLLDEMGLGPSVNQYVKKFSARTGLAAECPGCDGFHARYPQTIEVALFRILQEALTNVEAHSRATRVRVDLERRAASVQLTVQDNGRGFSPRAKALPKQRQLGLIAMRDRAELLGGQLQLFSEVGQGVRVVATIPYHGHSLAPSETISHERVSQGGQPEDENTNHHRSGTRRHRRVAAKENANPRRRASAIVK
jgi:two-component system sensor histidine kinase DegS